MNKKKPSGRPTDYEEKTNRLKTANEQDIAEKTIAEKNPIASKGKDPTFNKCRLYQKKKKHAG